MTLRTTTRRACATILLATAGTSLAACGDDDNGAAKGPVTKVDDIAITNATNLKVKPGIDIADVLPPKTLVKKDLVVGTGATVRSGQQLTARYVGVAWGSNKQFDASWDRKGQEQLPFTLAKGGVIDGWTEGLPGMKIGGRRLLIVPPAKGYGDQGQPPTIAAGETLVFVVDAKKVEKAPASATTGAAGAGQQLSQEQLQQAIQQAGASGAGAQTAP